MSNIPTYAKFDDIGITINGFGNKSNPLYKLVDRTSERPPKKSSYSMLVGITVFVIVFMIYRYYNPQSNNSQRPTTKQQQYQTIPKTQSRLPKAFRNPIPVQTKLNFYAPNKPDVKLDFEPPKRDVYDKSISTRNVGSEVNRSTNNGTNNSGIDKYFTDFTSHNKIETHKPFDTINSDIFVNDYHKYEENDDYSSPPQFAPPLRPAVQ